MQRSTLPLLVLAAASLAALGCRSENPYCYAAYESGVVIDSARIDPGFVCVASVLAAPTMGDSVRPDTARFARLRGARRADLMLSPRR